MDSRSNGSTGVILKLEPGMNCWWKTAKLDLLKRRLRGSI